MGFISTSLSVRQILENSNNVQTAAQSVPIQDAISISSANVIKFFEPSQEFDQLALNVLTTINQQKLSIATLGGNTGLASDCYSSDPADITSIYGSLVSGIAVTFGQSLGISAFSLEDPEDPLQVMTMVSYGTISYDTLQVFRYPNIEPATLNSSTDNPLDGGGYVTLTSSNLGIGKNTLYTKGAGSVIATVFAFKSAGCASYTGIVNSIAQFTNTYNSQSTGIVTHINNVNVIKEIKNSAQFEYWSLNKTNNNMSVGISSNSSVLSILENIGY